MDAHSRARLGVVLALAAWCLLVTATDPSSPARLVMVVASGLVVVVVAARRPGNRRRRGSGSGRRPRLAGSATWAVLVGGSVAFQLANFVRRPRRTYPTLSSLADLAFEVHAVQAVGFAGWLTLGWYLLARR